MFIPKQVFGISKVAAKESIRYAINGVNIRRNGDDCIAEATDGRRLMRVVWQEDRLDVPKNDDDTPAARIDDYSAVIPMADWDTVGKSIKKYRNGESVTSLAEVAKNKRKCAIEFTSNSNGSTQKLQTAEIDGHFPKTDDVIPQYKVGKNAVEIGVNPQLLGELLLAMYKTTDNTESRGARLIIPNDPGRPILIQSRNPSNGMECTSVLMPVHLGSYHCAKCCELKPCKCQQKSAKKTA